MDVLIRVGLIAFLVVICVRVFAPFMGLVLWALILTVALYPLHRRLANRFGGRQGRAATLLVVAGLLRIGVPSAMLGSSFASHVHDSYTVLENDTIEFKQPDPAVAEWPVVGKKIYAAWSLAANNLLAFVKKNQAQIESFSKYVLSVAASTAGSLFQCTCWLQAWPIMYSNRSCSAAAWMRQCRSFCSAPWVAWYPVASSVSLSVPQCWRLVTRYL